MQLCIQKSEKRRTIENRGWSEKQKMICLEGIENTMVLRAEVMICFFLSFKDEGVT